MAKNLCSRGWQPSGVLPLVTLHLTTRSDMRQIFILSHTTARQNAIEAVRSAPVGRMVILQDKTRTTDQNSLLWPLLNAISHQVIWHGQRLTADEWKDVFTAALKKQKVVPGLDGGYVICAQSTSRMSKSEFSDLIDLIYAFGAQKGVTFSDERRFADASQ